MTHPSLSVIIINYNTPTLVYDCLASLKQYLKCSYEVIVVENGSKPGSRVETGVLSSILPEAILKLAVSEKNLGFGRGNNLGAQNAHGEYLWFLNSDTMLAEDAASKLIDFLHKHSEVGAVSPLLYNAEGYLQDDFFASFQTLGTITFRRYKSTKVDLTKEYFYVDIVVGAAMMMRRTLFEKIGGFDKNIFMYLEDDDICKRIESEGNRNAVLVSAKVTHLEGRSSNKKFRKKLYYQSQTYFWNKHNGRLPTIIMRVLRYPWKLYMTRTF